jgi:hypothetical protein
MLFVTGQAVDAGLVLNMTGGTIIHIQVHHLLNLFHLFYVAVTGPTGDALRNMTFLSVFMTGVSFFRPRWQPKQRLREGTPATAERRALPWQYKQGIWLSPAWILWL